MRQANITVTLVIMKVCVHLPAAIHYFEYHTLPPASGTADHRILPLQTVYLLANIHQLHLCLRSLMQPASMCLSWDHTCNIRYSIHSHYIPCIVTDTCYCPYFQSSQYSAQGQVLHCKLRNPGCSFTRDG